MQKSQEALVNIMHFVKRENIYSRYMFDFTVVKKYWGFVSKTTSGIYGGDTSHADHYPYMLAWR